MKCPYHSDCPNQGTVEVAHGDESPVKVCLPHLGIYLSNGFTRTSVVPPTSNDMSVAECERWRDEAKRLGVEFYGGGALRHISCRECRALRNKVRAAQAAEKAAGITIPTPVEDVRGFEPALPLGDYLARYTGLEFPPLTPLTLAQRFSRLVAKAERNGVTLRLVIAPTEEYESLRNPRYRQIGDPGDLEEQLNIADAYLAGYGWSKR